MKIIGLSTIAGNWSTTNIPGNVTEILKLEIGDDILITLKNNNIYLKKYIKDIILEENEIYISSNTASTKQMSIRISADIRKLLDSEIGDKIIWLLDENNRIIIRNNFLTEKCSKKIINKDTSSMIIGLTSRASSGITSIPKDVRDMLGIFRDDLIYMTNEKGNILISKDFQETSKKVNVYDRPTGPNLYISRETKNLLNLEDKILWIFDEDGNIIIKNNDFPDECL